MDWAALYEGSYTADTLPSYVPKGKHVEMLNCGVPLTPHNLLDNSNFSNPIAQAGLNGMHGSTKYVCDRWISYDANATFGGNYIRPGSPIDQRLSKTVIDINKTYTAAFCYADGKIKVESGTFSNGFGSDALGIYCMKQENSTDYVTVRLNTGKEIHWAALYEGVYDASTLPAYQPKGYAAELAECRRYFRKFLSYYKAIGVIDGSNLYIQYILDPPMRDDNQSVTLDEGTSFWICRNSYNDALQGTAVVTLRSRYKVTIKVPIDAADGPCLVELLNGNLSISRDL